MKYKLEWLHPEPGASGVEDNFWWFWFTKQQRLKNQEQSDWYAYLTDSRHQLAIVGYQK